MTGVLAGEKRGRSWLVEVRATLLNPAGLGESEKLAPLALFRALVGRSWSFGQTVLRGNVLCGVAAVSAAATPAAEGFGAMGLYLDMISAVFD